MADNLSNVTVGADVKFPTHDVSLTDVDGKQAGLILCNRSGMKDPTQLKMSAMPRTPMQMTQGSAGYDDMELPFVAEVQTTMAGGRGSETLSSDRTKFFDSFRLDTTKEYPICAPATIAQAGLVQTSDIEPCASSPNFYWQGMSSRPQLFQYVCAAETVVVGISVYIASTIHREMDLYYSVLKDTNEEKPEIPDWATNNEKSEMKYSAHITDMLTEGEHYLSCEPITVAAGKNLYVIFYAELPSMVKVGTDVTGAHVYDGVASWVEKFDNTFLKCKIHTSGEFDVKLFEYKRQLYAVLNETNKDSAKLYMNGWRGVADANTAALSTLKDSTQTGWANDAAAGCIVLIINGKGEHEDQPWRRVVSSASGVLTVSSPWKIVHNTTTEYVVLGSNQWFQIDTTRGSNPEVNFLSQAVTSVAVAGNETGGSFIIFAFGQTSADPVLSYYTCYRTGADPNGVFTDSFSVDTAAKADLLMPIVNEQGKLKLWRADCDDCTVDYASLPTSGVPTTLNFDINAELRADLTLQRDRLYYSLWEELTNSQNDSLLQLTRQRDNLVVEATRLIGTGTPDNPASGSYLDIANDNYGYANDDVIRLTRLAEDTRLEAYRIIGDGTIATPATYDNYASGTQDSLLKMANASVTNSITDYASLVRSYNDLNLEHKRILEDYDRLTGTNKPIADYAKLMMEFNDLTVEHNRLIDDYTRLTGTNKPVSDETTLIRTYDDLTLEHNRLLVDYAVSGLTDAQKLVIERADQDNFIERKRLAGSSSNWTKTTMADVTFGVNDAIADDAYFGNNTAVAGSDIAIAVAYDEATTKIAQRDSDIYTEKVRLAGKGTGNWSITVRTYTFGTGIASNAGISAGTEAADGSEIKIGYSYDEATTELARRDYDIWVEKSRLAGAYNNTVWSMTNRTYTFGASGVLNHEDVLVSQVTIPGSDIAKALANSLAADKEVLELTNRITELIGNGSLVTPGVIKMHGAVTYDSQLKKIDADIIRAQAIYELATSNKDDMHDKAINIVGATGTVAQVLALSNNGEISTGIPGELKNVLNDIASEQARLILAVGSGSDLMRQILDLTYQITYTATESEDSARNAIDFPWTAANPDLAAHTDNVNSVAHKYLPRNIKCGSTSSRITNIVPYGTPVIPYIMKEDSFGSISDNIYQEIPLAELRSVRAENNGKTAMHYGVYLYFNLEGGRIERYFDQRIDDIGFNRDEGMPRERQGEVSKLVPYPGRFYAACNAGYTGYSTVMCNNGMGWHEIYRSGTAGYRITDIYIQAIPGNEYADRLWVSVGGYLIALPIAITPLQQYQYNYFGLTADEPGYVETSWVDFELKDVNKYFHSITIFSDYSSDIKSHQEYDIKVWFKVDDEKSWTYAGNTQAYPNKEIELRYPMSPTAAHNVSGKKIKFKIAMKPNQQYQTPRLKAIVINGVLRMPVKQSWNATFLLEPMSDLRKKTVTNKTLVTPTYPTAAPYDAKLYKRLQDWANSKTHATPLLMRTNDEVSDNHYVFIDPMSIQNVTVQQVMGSGSGEKEYKHIATVTLYEV